MKNYRDLIRHVKFEITNTRCCASIFTCATTMISDFSIIFILANFFRIFFSKCNILLHLDMVLILLLLTVTFFSFQNQLHFLRVFLKKYKTFSYNLLHNIKYVCFLCDQIPKLLTLNSTRNRLTYFCC